MHKNYVNCSDESFAEIDAERTAMQISYLAQCLDLEEKHFRGSDNENGELFHPDTSAAFSDIQDNAFQQFVSAKNSCEPDAWDYLVEAAELGHSLACRDVGDAHLYGSHEASCSVLTPVGQNLILAGKFLRKAFTDRVYSTGKSLALLMALNSSGVADEVNHLDMLTTGLLHFAASSGVKDAFAMLGSRYSASNSSDVEVATYHYYHAAAQAATEYHQLGQQPLHEMTRLFDSFERDVTAGERGDDDELIQFQKLRADQGDTVAMTDMGDLYYWGTHGVSRDHTQAYNYFNRAAQAGNVNAQSAVASMLLKGEGAARDDLTAIKWYEKASEKNHTRALNGLGYIHFHGTGGVEANKTLALEYFERAARNAEDGDSIFNAGYCYAMGLGTNANLSRAMEFYEVAARKFGHFDAIFEMGRMWTLGVPGVVTRNSEKALEYLKAASDNGQWGRSVRKGFDLYTNGQLERAVVLYHEARELGYPVAVSNLAFLYDQRLLQKGNMASEKRALKYLLLAHGENGDRETPVRIGDYHYYGLAGLRKDPKVALRWYSRASAEGDPVGAFNVGQMYEFGDGVEANLKRAQRYYDRSLELSVAAEAQVAIRFAMARLTIRKWVQNTPFETFLGLESPLETRADTNTSVASSAAMFDATTNFFYGNVYMIFSTGAVVCVSIGVWYFRSTQ